MRNDIQSSLSAQGISHSVYLYLHIFMWILFFRQTGMMNVWLGSCWDMWLPAELICGQATSSFTVQSGEQHFITAEPLHHLNMLYWRKYIRTQSVLQRNKQKPLLDSFFFFYKQYSYFRCFNHKILKYILIYINSHTNISIYKVKQTTMKCLDASDQYIGMFSSCERHKQCILHNQMWREFQTSALYTPPLIWSTLINQLIFLFSRSFHKPHH